MMKEKINDINSQELISMIRQAFLLKRLEEYERGMA